ncbi:sensor histidine kinase [Domibacillus iocasae]|uniref:histidine kinase n=1 Tax=Domibacillus iocasae TaxID=1714016 RepID=A0A1E7DLA0_9BACI|nr:ATP-binding protein [Domibacillus iocasae]OES43862.1 two-component sensor histidine kinase [Domibacillus iocasae]
MKKRFIHMSFRHKILTVLLVNTLLLSGFSLVFVQSIEDVQTVGHRINKTDIPEVVWISYWKEDINIKKYIVESYLSGSSGGTLIGAYEEQDEKTVQPISGQKVAIPKTLEPFSRDIDRLDFLIENNVKGLLLNGNNEKAAAYVTEQYLPELNRLKVELEEKEAAALSSLSGRANRFSEIIKTALLVLLFFTTVALILSIYGAYWISRGLTKPIEKMIRSVDAIASGHYGLIVTAAEQEELKTVTDSINKMSVRLKESFETITAGKVYREQILNSLPVGIITSDDKTGLFSLNTFAKHLLNTQEDTFQYLAETDFNQNKAFWHILRSKRICQNEKISFSMNEKLYQLLVSQTELFNDQEERIGRIFYFIDFTQVNELEQRMRQSEKLAVLGEMAAGAAHEIRNPLAVIQGFLTLMENSFSDKEKEQYYIPLVLKELGRINAIIENMLLMSKPEAPILKEVRLEDLIRDILPLITQSAEKDIEFTLALDPQLLHVDPNQMKQIFHNLIRNSMEAIEEKGHISIQSTVENGWYRIDLQDTGPGITEQMQKTLFDPFSTSKEGGTGLGLPLVQRMIESHGGTINLTSTSEAGTTFCILLPIE